ncbi:MAG: transcriptional repressor, partial [Thermodesulfobacteriota bacterium]
HDHLICLNCGNILEFKNKGIENLQEEVARQHGFFITYHVLELYGYCRKCSAEKNKETNMKKL